MYYFLMAFAVIVILVALSYFRKLFFTKTDSHSRKKQELSNYVNCPVCNSLLLPGQNLISKVFRPAGKVDDQLCYVYGCPNCYPNKKNGIERTCPCCHKTVSQDGYLVSRMFNKTKSGKPHVIINGCGNCNRSQKN